MPTAGSWATAARLAARPAGTGLRSAISAIGDIDLDGVPEIVAGPTAYRMSGGS